MGGSNTVENESVEDLDARRSKVVRTVKSDVRRVSPADHRKVVSSDGRIGNSVGLYIAGRDANG